MNTLIFAAAVAGLLTALLLYRTALLRREVRVTSSHEKIRLPESRSILDAAEREHAIREKLDRVLVNSSESEKTARALTKIVKEEADELLQEIKQEYSVKYQVIAQEKNKEVEVVRKQYQNVKEKYDQIEVSYKKVEAEKKQTDAVVRSIAEGLVVVNKNGEVLMMNPSAEKLLGVPSEKKKGKSILEGVSDQFLVSLSRESGDDKAKTIEMTSKNENTRKVIRSSSAVIQNEDGDTVGMVNILTDVTKQKELDEVKTKFVSNVTHEFRTPIVAMQKSTAILLSPQAGPLNETQINFLNIISRNLGHLSRLVEDLLDIAEIDAGKLKIRVIPTRLDKVINNVCDTLDTWAKSKNIQIIRELDRTFPEIPMDPDKITQVLNNLIGNAIKFTAPGGIITVTSQWGKDPAWIEVSVKDTGVGITKENMARLFVRFEQFGSSEGIAGTGLGLSITKEIVERHGGKILVDSVYGKGSVFTFTLPSKPHRNAGG